MRLAVAVLITLLAAPLAAQEAPGWQAVVGDLAAERTRAETCVRLLTRHAADEPAVLSRGELAYGEAKARMDAVIASLAIVVSEGEGPEALPQLDERLEEALDGRRTFCASVVELVPGDAGAKTVLADLFAAVAEPIVEGVFGMLADAREEERLVRQTIRIQLEAQRWPAFAEVAP